MPVENSHNLLPQLLDFSDEYAPAVTAECEIMGIPNFIRQFRTDASKATSRVWLQTMYLFPSHFSDLLTNALMRSGDRNIDTRLYTDGIQRPLSLRDKMYAKLLGKKSERTHQYKATMLQNDAFRAHNVKTIVSRPFGLINYVLFSYLRNHFKLAIVDNVAWIGGLNAGKDGDYNRIDFMVKFSSPDFVDAVAHIVEHQQDLDENVSEEIDGYDLLVDAGLPGESIIYETVLQRLKDIQDPNGAEITLLSPWVPDNELLEVLHQLHQRGAQIRVLTSYHKFQIAFEGIYAVIKNFNTMMMKLKKMEVPILYTPLEVHGKMLLIKEGEQAYAVITTHNLVTQGVKMGTAEIAVGSAKPGFVSQCKKFLEKVTEVSSQDRT